jgi:hypothetical protein
MKMFCMSVGKHFFGQSKLIHGQDIHVGKNGILSHEIQTKTCTQARMILEPMLKCQH